MSRTVASAGRHRDIRGRFRTHRIAGQHPGRGRRSAAGSGSRRHRREGVRPQMVPDVGDRASSGAIRRSRMTIFLDFVLVLF
jgi:hypothetical protein